MSNVGVVAPLIKGSSGTASYVSNTLKALQDAEIPFDLRYVKKFEISLLGKPFFGIFFQYISSSRVRMANSIVHSLSPEVVTKRTNVVTLHDVIPFTSPELYMKSAYDRLAYRLGFGRASKVPHMIVSTNYGKSEIVSVGYAKEETVSVINQSIDHSIFFPDGSNPYSTDKLKVVMVSDFNPRKRIDLVVKALAFNKEIDFFHIGPTQGWSENYQHILNLAGEAKNIFFLGRQPLISLRRYVSNADLFIYLSNDEGFGLPPLEAMACGTNVLASDIPVFKELLTGAASLVPNETFDADSVFAAMRNKKPPEELIQHSREFSIERLGKNMKAFYDSID